MGFNPIVCSLPQQSLRPYLFSVKRKGNSIRKLCFRNLLICGFDGKVCGKTLVASKGYELLLFSAPPFKQLPDHNRNFWRKMFREIFGKHCFNQSSSGLVISEEESTWVGASESRFGRLLGSVDEFVCGEFKLNEFWHDIRFPGTSTSVRMFEPNPLYSCCCLEQTLCYAVNIIFPLCQEKILLLCFSWTRNRTELHAVAHARTEKVLLAYAAVLIRWRPRERRWMETEKNFTPTHTHTWSDKCRARDPILAWIWFNCRDQDLNKQKTWKGSLDLR